MCIAIDIELAAGCDVSEIDGSSHEEYFLDIVMYVGMIHEESSNVGAASEYGYD